MTASVVWGCLAAVLSSGIQSLGITLQRKAHVTPYSLQLDADPSRRSAADDGGTHTYKRNLWLTGLMLFIVANVLGSLVQLTTLPLIVLSPLQSIGLIFNSVLSCVFLPGEHFTAKLAAGTGIIAAGALAIAYNGASTLPPQPSPSVDERLRLLLHHFSRPGFLTWWCFTFVLMAVLLRANWALRRRVKALESPRKQRQHTRSRLVLVRGSLYGVISGTLTAHTFLFAKSVVDVAVETVLQRSAPQHSSTYVLSVLLLVVMLCIVAMQLVAFNMGLSNMSPAILYPLCFLVYNSVNLCNDLSFNQLLRTGAITPRQLVLVVVGLAAVFVGVVLISWDSAFGGPGPETQPLLAGKFPYDDLSTKRVLSYEESEIMSQLEMD